MPEVFFFFSFQWGNSAISEGRTWLSCTHRLTRTWLAFQNKHHSFLKCQQLCAEESCSQRQVRDQSWDVTQRAITTPRGTAQIPLESAHKFISTCLITEQFPSFLIKVGFSRFLRISPSCKEANIPVCAKSCFLGSVLLEGGVPCSMEVFLLLRADPLQQAQGILSQHLCSCEEDE